MEVMRVREDSRQLDGRVELDDAYLGGKAGRGSENKVLFVAAVQTTPNGQPQFVCLRQQPFTQEQVAVFAARSIAPTGQVQTAANPLISGGCVFERAKPALPAGQPTWLGQGALPVAC
jgi:hypothetical protein